MSRKIESRLGDLLAAPTRRERRAIARVASPLPFQPHTTPRRPSRPPRPRCAPLQVPRRGVSVNPFCLLVRLFLFLLLSLSVRPLALTQARGIHCQFSRPDCPTTGSLPFFLPLAADANSALLGDHGRRTTDGVPPSLSRSLIKRQRLALAPR